MTIRKLNKEEITAGLDLAWQVFLRFEAPDYTQEGVDEFYKSIHDENYLSNLTMYGAFVQSRLVGVIATRSEGRHIALFFVDEQYQKQGIGRQMFECVKKSEMTVNASPYAVRVYRALGFVETDKEQVVHGLRFTPMKYVEIITKRLVLRRWKDSDAADLYTYAKDERVGPIAGWPPHTSVENSREIIRTVFAAPETYAITDKNSGKAIGSIGLLVGAASNFDLPTTEGEIGYWLGVPYWGQGLVPEAVCALLRHAFEDLALEKVWCGYFEGNEQSRRVQEKCGFIYRFTRENIEWKLMNDIRTEHITCLTRQEWLLSTAP